MICECGHNVPLLAGFFGAVGGLAGCLVTVGLFVFVVRDRVWLDGDTG